MDPLVLNQCQEGEEGESGLPKYLQSLDSKVE